MTLSFIDDAPDAPDAVNALLYGPPGAGKTAGACSSPGPILYLNAEGPNALAFGRKIARGRGTTIHEVRVDPKAGGMRKALTEIVAHVRSGGEPVCRTLVVDTVGRIREGLINELVQRGSKNTLQQFGQVNEHLSSFVQALRDLPVNLVLLAHESVEDSDGDRIVRPMIGGQQAEMIPAEVDVVAYCSALREGDKVEYVAQFVESKGRRAKDRSGGLGLYAPIDLSVWFSTFREALGAPVGGEQPLPESETEPDRIDAERVEALTAALRELQVKRGTARSWLIEAGCESVPTDLQAAIAGLTPEQADVLQNHVDNVRADLEAATAEEPAVEPQGAAA
jgi:hypothetical protein